MAATESSVQAILKETDMSSVKKNKKSGKIGTRPKSKRATLKQSISDAYSKAKKSNGRKTYKA